MDRPWAAVQDALTECARISTWARSPQELIDDVDWVQMLSCQLAALNLELLREIDAQGIPARQGAANTTAWIRDRYRLSAHTASQQVRLAAALDTQLPETAAALADGSINPEQAQVIAKAVTTLPAQYQADGEKFLISQCPQLGPKELGWLAERLLDRIAPEVAERRAAEQLARSEERAYTDRRLHLTDLHGDTRVRISGWLDRESAAIVRAALDPLCAPRPNPDRADPRDSGLRDAKLRDAKLRDAHPPDTDPRDAHPRDADPRDSEVGDSEVRDADPRGSSPRNPDPRTSDPRASDPRTSDPRDPHPRAPGQRRADALVDVCRLALASRDLPDNGGDRPQVVITADIDTLREQTGAATLDDGSALSPAAARRLACDARILPAVMNGTGQVLDVGRERRLFTGPLRRALVLRDRGCCFPGCDRPARWCEAHHVISWLDHGPTSLNNAALLCGYHHRVIHQGQWRARIATDGLPEFIPPPYIDPQQQARRNNYHRRQ